MSDINLDFTVNNNSINFTVEPNDITITPTDIQLTFNTSSQLNAGGSNTQLQYNNNTLLAGIPNVTWNGSKLSLGNVANVLMTGGTNGYVLQTDGTGNLSWTAQTGGGGGNGTPGGANTQIQYNDSGLFGGNAGFTFDETSGNVNMPANLIIAGNIYGNIANANYANFAGTAYNVSGSNVTGAVAYATTANSVAGSNVSGAVAYATTANSVAGANVSGAVAYATTANAVAGANVSGAVAYATTANSVAGSNVSGQVANALVAGTVYTNAQPNITSVGTLTSLSITGNLSSGNANLGNAVFANFFIGSGNNLSNIQGSNIIGFVGNANYANTAGQLTLTSVFSNSIQIGANTGVTFPTPAGAISIGGASRANGLSAVAVGNQANAFGNDSTAIGPGAVGEGATSIAIGYVANASYPNTIAIGRRANSAGANSISIGSNAIVNSGNTIFLNATGNSTPVSQADSLFIKPIRDVTGNAQFTVTLKYNPTTGEIGYV